MLTEPELERIVSLATPLWERPAGGASGARAAARRARWAASLSPENGGEEALRRRLAWVGLSLAEVEGRLDRPPSPGGTPPAWVETLRVIDRATGGRPSRASDLAASNGDTPVPFGAALAPAVEVAYDRLLVRLGRAGSPRLSARFCEDAGRCLRRALLLRLAEVCGPTLVDRFTGARSFGEVLLARRGVAATDPVAREGYERFVAGLLDGGLSALFLEYPVLARLVATVVDHWVGATALLVSRFERDADDLAATLFPSLHPSPPVTPEVATVSVPLSDFHRGGQAVLALTLRSGERLVYKPRDVRVEIAFADLLGWCSHRGFPLDFHAPRTLARDGYGWVEHVDQRPCADAAAVRRFYQRAGGLLCQLYVLGAVDCHRENLIAHGEHPILVDLETLLQPEPRPPVDEADPLWESVLRTGFLPSWELDADGHPRDISGLGGVEAVVDQHEDGATLALGAHVPELASGFAAMYRVLSSHREELASAAGPLAPLRGVALRYAHRPTKVYTALLARTLQPALLGDGADRSIALELVARAYLMEPSEPPDWPLLAAELEALERLDVPWFGTGAESAHATEGLPDPLLDDFRGPSHDRALARLATLAPDDLERQQAFVRGAFHARVARGHGAVETTPGAGDDAAVAARLSPDALVEEAAAIAADLAAGAIWTGRTANWLGLACSPDGYRYHFQLLEPGLYAGSCGVALFLSTLDQVTSGSPHRELALAVLRPLQQLLAGGDAGGRVLARLGLGAATGTGSIVYALAGIHRAWRAAEGRDAAAGETSPALACAQSVARLITPERIGADDQLDACAGVAGAILGLLRLFEHTREPWLLDRAVACGRHLLASRVTDERGQQIWRPRGGPPRTGLAHGAAGITLALLRLYHETGDPTLLAAAEEGIAYERSVLSAAERHDGPSLDGEPPIPPASPTSWCNGAAGRLMARLGGLTALAGPAVLADVEAAVQTTLTAPWTEVDQLCCGQLGRVEALLVAAQRLGDPALAEVAQGRAAGLVATARREGGYRLFPELPRHVSCPGLFIGSAGIGYQLLRLAHPEAVASVLLWE